MKARAVLLFATATLCAFWFSCKPSDRTGRFSVPFEYHKLDNGLRIVLSEDKTAPIVCVAVYYNIGFRIEPRSRTGFAHLFEHMMFQGSTNLGKMEFIKLVQKNGGILNGSTRFDFTNYFEVVPSHKLETVLWAEADRMMGLKIDERNLQNQKEVVKNEVKVNVLNQPYGGFPWLDMPQHANSNWYNAHNFYGELADLDAATLTDVEEFFKTYYAPNNAVIVVSGDFDKSSALEMIRKYFSAIPMSQLPPKPDISEPPQEAEKIATRSDKLAGKPAIAFAYHMPERNSPEYFAMGLIDQILLQGSDSRLHEALVKKRGFTGEITGGINYLGNMFNYNGPMVWMADLIHDSTTSADSIMAEVDLVIEELQTMPVSDETMNRALIKMRSSLYGEISSVFGFGRADLLACYALFDDDPGRINGLEKEFTQVTPGLLQATARRYLRHTNRTVLKLVPGK